MATRVCGRFGLPGLVLHSVPRLFPGLPVLLLALTTPHASAQIAAGGVLLENVRVLTGDGRELPQAAILIRGERIAAVGQRVRGGFLTRKVDLGGRFVTPGLIDVWSTLALRAGATQARAYGSAADDFDPFAEHDIRAALSRGITMVYVPARSADGVGGFGAVVRLLPGASRDEMVVQGRAALAVRIGGPAHAGTVSRIRTVEQLRSALRAALDYRDALEAYEDDLKDYLEELDKQRKAGEASGKSGRPGARRSGMAARARKGSPEKDGDKGKEKKKKKGPKKPEKPERDLKAEALLEALDGKVRMRVEVYRTADIINVLDLAREFNLALVLEGASGAHHLARRIADQQVPVVFDALPAPLVYAGGRYAEGSPDALRRLLHAGVEVFLASGPRDGEGPASAHLALRAAQAVAQGMDRDVALRRITRDAARLLGIDDRYGHIARGMAADLVVWSDHPFAPGARVERVYVAGREVYRAGDDGAAVGAGP